MSHRIKNHEIWWILGTVIAARLVSAVMGLAIFGQFAAWWLVGALAVAMAVPAMIGLFRAQATREQFTIGYLGALLGESDRRALMDLVTELRPGGASSSYQCHW